MISIYNLQKYSPILKIEFNIENSELLSFSKEVNIAI